MILQRLRVEHFRRHNLAVDIALNDRLTIIAGLNEAGKTTLFEALQYAFFRRSGSAGKDIEALAPWDTDGLSPAVTVEFEHLGWEYQLEKTWGKRGTTRLKKRVPGATFVSFMADNADDFLATLFAGQPPRQGQFTGFTGQHMGLAYLLFVPQGSVPIAGENKVIGLNTDARARMTEIIGAASQSPKAASIAKAISEAYSVPFTKTGKRSKNADAAKSSERISDVESRLADTRAKLEAFERAAEQLDAAQRSAANAVGVAAAAKSAADSSRPRYQAAVELKAAFVKAEGDFARAEQHYGALIAENRQREETSRKLEDLRPVAVAAESALSQAQHEHGLAVTAFEKATAPDPDLERLESQVNVAQQAALARQRMESLAGQVARADAIQKRIFEIDAECAATVRVTELDATASRALVEAERELRTRLEAVETSVEVVAERELTVLWQSGTGGGKTAGGETAGSQERTILHAGERLAQSGTGGCETAGGETAGGQERKILRAGESLAISADSRLVVQIEGLARFDVRGPISDAGALRTKLSESRQKIADVQKAFGTADPLELQQRLVARQGVESERTRLAAELDVLLGGISLADRKKTLEEQKAGLGSAPDERETEALRALVAERKLARTSLVAELTAKTRSAAERVAGRSAALTAAQRARAVKELEWCGLEAQLASLQRDGRSEADRGRLLDEAYMKRFEAERARTNARTAYEPYRGDGDPLAVLGRLQNEADRTLRAELAAKALVQQLEATLAGGFAEAPSSELTRLEEEQERLRAQLADEELTEEALKLLQRYVVEADARRVATFAQPVLDRVAPWFRDVTGNELVSLDLSSDNQVNGLRLAGIERSVRFDELSQGTCDQLALLIRLGFASLLTSAECLGAMPVLLDDPLVHADWQRRPRFRDVLADVSKTAQVIVFTCRPEDYHGLPGELVKLGSSERLEVVAAGVG
jgi:hypothetical protein